MRIENGNYKILSKIRNIEKVLGIRYYFIDGKEFLIDIESDFLTEILPRLINKTQKNKFDEYMYKDGAIHVSLRHVKKLSDKDKAKVKERYPNIRWSTESLNYDSHLYIKIKNMISKDSISITIPDNDQRVIRFYSWSSGYVKIGTNLTAPHDSLRHIDYTPDKTGVKKYTPNLTQDKIKEFNKELVNILTLNKQ